jgi:hypothetical protein
MLGPVLLLRRHGAREHVRTCEQGLRIALAIEPI